MMTAGIVVACLVIAIILRLRRNRRIRAWNCVTAPKVLLLDLSDGLDADLVSADRALYGEGFSVVKVSTRPDVLETSRFDVLHVFARADRAGRIAGLTPQGFMIMLEAAWPRLVVMASSNPASALPGPDALRAVKRPFNII